MKGIQLILILLTLFASQEISACSCVNVPETFSENIRANHTIFRGTVLEHIEIPNDSNYLLIHHSLTKIQVIEWYQNKMKSDIIYYANVKTSPKVTQLKTRKIDKFKLYEKIKI